MTEDLPADLAVLPAGVRLLHIGAPKTGTTALQTAARDLRATLLEHGVAYPGSALNHQRPLSALIGRTAESWGGSAPPREWWAKFHARLPTDDTRVLMSFELVCQADRAGVQRVHEAVGPNIHAVMVLRNFGHLLPSMWQQTVKMGSTRSLATFLRTALADPTAVKIPGSDAFHRDDGLNVIERWADELGPDKVTVVVLDPGRPSRLFDAFERMLDLPSGVLSTAPRNGYETNRSMSAVEAELIRRINDVVIKEWRVPKAQHRELLWMGAADRLLAMRKPSPDEGRIELPAWAVVPAQEAGSYLAETIRKTGVRVIGNLDALETDVPAGHAGRLTLPERIPSDLSIEAILGIFARAIGQSAFHSGPLCEPDITA